MSDVGSWRRHRDGDAEWLLVAVDFPLTGRWEAGFADFAPLLGGRFDLWETLPPLVVADSAPVCGAAYPRTWLADLRPAGRPVAAVLTFCAGAAFAGAMAEAIGQWQGQAPRTVAFDPEMPGTATLQMQYLRALQRFAPLLSEDEMGAAQESAHRMYEANSADIGALRLAVREELRRISAVGFDRAGLEPRHREELLGAFDSFACYLVAGAQVSAGRDDREKPVAISSSTPTNGLNLLPEDQWAGLVSKEIRFDVAHSEMLRNADVAAAVVELLD